MSISLKTAAIVQLLSKLLTVLVQLGITAVLARILAPAEFGLVAMISVFLNFFLLFAEMGIGPAIVQFSDFDEVEFRALFGFTIVAAVILVVAFCGVGYVASGIYDYPHLLAIMAASSASIFFAVINMVPNGLIIREKRFLGAGIRSVVVTTLSGVGAVAMALAGCGYWSLIAQVVAMQAGLFVWNFLARPIGAPTFRFGPVLKRIRQFSGFQFGSTFVNYFSRNLDNLLIGHNYGAAPLGIYDKAYRLTTYPMTMIASVLGSVLQPYMTAYRDEPRVMFGRWLHVAKLLSIFGVYFSVVGLACAKDIIVIFYGPQWIRSVPLFGALSLSVWAQMLANPSSAFFQALQRTDLAFVMSVVNTILTCIGLVAGLWIGSLVAIGWCVGLGLTAHTVSVGYFLVHRGFGASYRQLAVFVPELAAGVVVYAALEIGISGLASLAPWSRLSWCLLASLAAYVGLLFVFRQASWLRPLVRRS